MELTLYQVDAFTNKLFGGNPAAVVPLKQWLPEIVMQKIAAENNLSETAFYVPRGNEFELKWFTPKAEIALCGHATLGTAYVIYEIQKSTLPQLNFHTKSGVLTVTRSSQMYSMNFPSDILDGTHITDEIHHAIGLRPAEAYYGRNVLMVLLNSENELAGIQPDPEKVKRLHPHGLIATAKGENTDFVSRCFFPNYGISEDPVTGSAHTILTPYWAKRLNKNILTAQQISERVGELTCRFLNDRVEISGEAVLYLEGKIFVD